MLRKNLIPVWIGIIVLSGMFLMGQEPYWPPAPTEKTVFVTQSAYYGNLGGLTGADMICQAEASVAGLAGTYMAWLSDSAEGPDTRFVKSTIPYVDVNGTRIAANWNDLTDGWLDNPISVAPNGSHVFAPVWTNTRENGEPLNYRGNSASDSCYDWTEAHTMYGATGLSSEVLLQWTNNYYDQYCWELPFNIHLYCFQQ
jgi:hypothetical protein